MSTGEYPTKLFRTPVDWEQWLRENHDSANGVWLKIAKKDSGVASVNYDQALEAALCYGWIDGQVRGLDSTFYLQRFTPRRARSTWSKRNVGIAEQLIQAGRMRPAGLVQIEAAKQDGRWAAAYAGSKAGDVPPELQAALDEHPKAKAFFESLSKSQRFAFCFRIQTAKKPETKQAHVEKYIKMLRAGQKLT